MAVPVVFIVSRFSVLAFAEDVYIFTDSYYALTVDTTKMDRHIYGILVVVPSFARA